MPSCSASRNADRVGERGQADVADTRAVQVEPAEVEQHGEQTGIEFHSSIAGSCGSWVFRQMRPRL